MLQLTRTMGQSIRIGDQNLIITEISNKKIKIELTQSIGGSLILENNAQVKILEIARKQVRLGISAPKNVAICREELEITKQSKE